MAPLKSESVGNLADYVAIERLDTVGAQCCWLAMQTVHCTRHSCLALLLLLVSLP